MHSECQQIYVNTKRFFLLVQVKISITSIFLICSLTNPVKMRCFYLLLVYLNLVLAENDTTLGSTVQVTPESLDSFLDVAVKIISWVNSSLLEGSSSGRGECVIFVGQVNSNQRRNQSIGL